MGDLTCTRIFITWTNDRNGLTSHKELLEGCQVLGDHVFWDDAVLVKQQNKPEPVDACLSYRRIDSCGYSLILTKKDGFNVRKARKRRGHIFPRTIIDHIDSSHLLRTGCKNSSQYEVVRIIGHTNGAALIIHVPN